MVGEKSDAGFLAVRGLEAAAEQEPGIAGDQEHGAVFHRRSDGIRILPEVGSCRCKISGQAVTDVDEIIASRGDGYAQLHLGDSRLIAQL